MHYHYNHPDHVCAWDPSTKSYTIAKMTLTGGFYQYVLLEGAEHFKFATEAANAAEELNRNALRQ